MSAYIIKDKLKKIIKLEHINRRISILKIITSVGVFNGYAILGVYLSSTNNTNKEYELDLEILSLNYRRLKREGFKPLIAGDLNADTGRLKYTNDKILKNWLGKKNFKEVSRLYLQNIPNTFLNSRGQYSNIDHFIIEDGLLWQEIKQVNIIFTNKEKSKLCTNSWKNAIKGNWDYENNSGDHRPVTLNLSLAADNECIRRIKENCKNNKRKRIINWKNSKHKSIYNNFLREFLKDKKYTHIYAKHMDRVETEKCVHALEEITKLAHTKAIDKIHGSKKDRRITNRRGGRVDVDIDLTTLKNTYEGNFNNCDKSQVSINLESRMLEVVEKYAKLIKKHKINTRVKCDVIVRILKNLKNNKKGGHNGCTNEMYKYGVTTELPKVIANLFENIIRGGFFPNNLNIGQICTIIKDSTVSNKEIDNTRPITLSEVLSIILEHFMLTHIHKRILHRHQFGFRQKSSCVHAVFSLNEIIEDVKMKKTNAYAVFLDFSKAFDKVNRTKLMYKLIGGLEPGIWLLIKNYYENLIIYVTDKNKRVSEPFKATVGVKQGGPASPDLFNDYINLLLVQLEVMGNSYKLGGVEKGVMVYADDTTVICHTLENLNISIAIIEKYCDLYDIKINAKKTKWMLIGEPDSIIDPVVKVNGEILDRVEEFKFLGVIISSDGKPTRHIKKRKSLFLNGLTEITTLGLNKKDVPLKMKSLLYTSLVRSKLMYGMETIKFNKTEVKQNLTKPENYALKKSCGLNNHSKATSLIYAMDITPIALYLIKRKLLFILQLLANVATNELITKGIHRTLDDIFVLIGVERNHVTLGRDRYQGVIRSAVTKKLLEIKDGEMGIRKSGFVLSVKYLLENRSPNNDDTLQYLLDPRRVSGD
jgi:hypothetical protein